MQITKRTPLPTLALVILANSAAVASAEPAGITSEPMERVLLRDGRLSVDLRSMTLDAALAEIATQAGFTLEIRGALGPGRPRRFAGLPVAEGLRRLLDGHDSVMRLAPVPEPSIENAQAGRRITALVVLGRDDGSLRHKPRQHSPGIAATSPDYQDFAAQSKRLRWRAIGDLDRQGDRAAATLLREIVTRDPDPGIRTNAAAALSRAPRRIAGAALTAALDDPETRVRIQALRSLRAVQGRRALRRLQELALHDRDPEVRRMAVHLSASLGDRATATILESALTDPAHGVRDAAAAAIENSGLN